MIHSYEIDEQQLEREIRQLVNKLKSNEDVVETLRQLDLLASFHPDGFCKIIRTVINQ